jgi:protein pelota
MKIKHKDLKKGEIKVEITSLEDLWYLSNIIDVNDTLKGKTLRKIKLGEGTDRNTKVVKKAVFLDIHVERVDFHKYSSSLRVSGKIIQGTEDVPKGSYHTFDINIESILTLTKKEWLKYQLDKINEACSEKMDNILIVAMDRDEASFALLSTTGYKMLSEIKGEVSKKEYKETKGKDFYAEVVKNIEEYAQRFSVKNIILASPAFWKEEALKALKKKNSNLAKQVTLATSNNTGKNGIEEVLKRDEVKTVLKRDRTSKETQIVEQVFKEVSTNGAVAYGLKEVKQAADATAIKELLLTDDFIQKKRAEESFAEVDKIMRSVDKAKGSVHIISTEHDAGKKLDGLGGIAAILRYKLK